MKIWVLKTREQKQVRLFENRADVLRGGRSEGDESVWFKL